MDKFLAYVIGFAGLVLILLGLVKYNHTHSFPPKNNKVMVTGNFVPALAPLPIPTLNSKKIFHMRLHESQVVVLTGEIGTETDAVSNEITTKALDNKPLFLLINSPGGSVLEGALIISAMESVKVPVYTVCMQLCASMAAIIHQYGTKRFALDRSVLMFHDAAGGVQGYLPHIHNQLAMIERYVLKFDVYIANKAKMKLEDLTNLQSKNIWIDAEDALGKFTDKLVYVDVLSNGTQLNMKVLLNPKPMPVKNSKSDTATVPELFDVQL